MAKTNPDTIVLKGQDFRYEAKAAEAGIYPGMLVELTSTTTEDNVQRQSTAADAAPEPLFALEDDVQGKTIDTVYTINERVQYGAFRPGDEVYAWLDDGEDITKGDVLEAAGNGKLQARTTGKGIAVAMESVDMSGSSSADPSGRIKVRIL